jgi:antitoxin (DNA-binding transcriptional repressor) of toxin-antitoxin stability system
METIPISRFRATCLAVLEGVRLSGEPVLVTRRGLPLAEVVPPSHPAVPKRVLGGAPGKILGDIVSPVIEQSASE